MSPRRKRPIIIGLAIVLALVIGGALLFRACAPMTVASWGATSALEAVVGDRGTVRSSAVDQSFTSPKRCELRVSVREGTTADGLAGLLADIAPAARYEPCTVTTIAVPNGSLLFLEGLPQFALDQWTAIAEHLTRGPATISVGTGLSPAVVSPSLSGADLQGTVDSLHAAVSGDRLEDLIGPISWGAAWKLPGPPYHSVDIESSGTPPMELVAFLEALAPILDATDASVGLRYENRGAGPVTRLELTAPDAQLEADVAAAFTASGMPGELIVTDDNTASIG